MPIDKFIARTNIAKTNDSGFTLTELAIVMVIVALLIGGMLVPLSAQKDRQYSSETKILMSEIKDSLLGFVAVNGRLPCPASPTIASGTANAGIEYPLNAAKTACSTASEGVLPWATLGVPETDAWGRRLTYRVANSFAKAVPSGSNAAFSLASTGDITVLATAGGAPIASSLPLVVISHGKNGFRAYLSDGSQMDASPDADENANGNGDATFVSKTQTQSYDDLVEWISPNILFNRMIAAGKLP